MKPICRFRTSASARSSNAVRSCPASCTEPAVGRSSVPIMFNNVLFPDPEGPIIASDSPGESVRSTPLRIGRSEPVAPEYFFVTPDKRRRGGSISNAVEFQSLLERFGDHFRPAFIPILLHVQVVLFKNRRVRLTAPVQHHRPDIDKG